MNEFLGASSTWGSVLTIACFGLFRLLQTKLRRAWLNPLLLSGIVIGAFLLALNIPYSLYRNSSSMLSGMLLPATVSLAVPLYEQWQLLKRNLAAILCGIASGVITGLAATVLLAKAFRLDRSVALSFLPKSVTTAIGADIAAELGGIPSLAIVLIILTGICGNMLAPVLCKWFRLRDPVARGIAIGTCSHALGTSKALEMGEAEGAMSGLAIAVAGVMTAVLVPLAAMLL